MDTLEIFNTYQDGIQKLFRSRLLLQIMISLGEGDKTLSELRVVTGTTSQTILPKIRFLEGMHYIQPLDDAYHLTPRETSFHPRYRITSEHRFFLPKIQNSGRHIILKQFPPHSCVKSAISIIPRSLKRSIRIFSLFLNLFMRCWKMLNRYTSSPLS